MKRFVLFISVLIFAVTVSVITGCSEKEETQAKYSGSFKPGSSQKSYITSREDMDRKKEGSTGYIVQEGDDLTKISEKVCGTKSRAYAICYANKFIENCDEIDPGWVITIPPCKN